MIIGYGARCMNLQNFTKGGNKRMKRRFMARGLSALLITSVFMNMMPVSAAANEGSSVGNDAQWETLRETLKNYTPVWNDATYKGAVAQRMIETALMGNGDVGVNSSGNSKEKSYLISKQDFWNCGNMNTDNIGSADAGRVSPLSVGGLTIREMQEEEEPEIKPTVTGCGFIDDANPEYVYDLDGIIDGKMDKDKDSWACKGTDHEPDAHWFEINLNQVKSIRGYEIYHHMNPLMYTSDFEVSVSSDGINYETVQTVTDNDQQKTSFQFEQAKEIQYIKVDIAKPNADRDNTARILEMELLESTKAAAKVTGCGYISDADPAYIYDLEGIIDDKMEQDKDTWACNGNEHADDKKSHWFQVDFGEVNRLKKYVLYHQGSYNNAQTEMNTSDFEVRVSKDGENYETVQTVTENLENATEFILDEAIEAQYVKVFISKANPGRDSTARIAEMRFYDEANKNLITGDIVYDFKETLDITDGRLDTNMEISGIPITCSSWISATDNVMVTEITSTGEEPLNLESAVWTKADLEDFPLDSGVDGDMVWASKKTVNLVENQNEKSWTSEVVLKSKVLGTKAAAEKSKDSEAVLKFTIEPGQTVQIVTSVGGGGQNYDFTGNLQGMEPQNEASDILAQYQNAQDLASLKESNDQWWKDYWLKSYINIGDEQLHRYYYGSLYYMACTSREDSLPPGLYGIWTTTDGAMWNGDFHMNYNFIAPFYGMHSSNRGEFSKSLKDPLLDFMENGSQRAKTDIANVYYNYIYGGNQPGENGTAFNNGKFDGRPELVDGIDDGILYPVALGPWGSYAWGGEAGGYLMQVYNAGFAAMGLTQYYNYTKDGDYLKEIYPYLLANANFYEKWCEKEDLGDGKYRYNIWTGAHENTFDMNSGTAIGTVKNILECLIDGTEDGNIFPPAEKLAVWKDMYENFADYPIQDFVPQSDANFTYDKPYVPLSEVGAKFRAHEANVGLEFIAPGQQLGYDTDPELREAARNSIELKELANKNIWSQINETPKVYLHAVRCGVDPQYIISKFKQLLDSSMCENFVIQDGYHGIEKAGAIEFINTMLLQSDNDIIKVFPNWTGADASFTRLRERGAFLLSSSMTGGQVDYIEITSEKGEPVKLVNPWENSVVRVTDQSGQEIDYKKGSTVNTGEKTIEFESTENAVYTIEYAGEEPADYTNVDAALSQVPQDLTIYTRESAAAVTDAVNAVVRDLTIDRQADVDAMAAAIEKAVRGLITQESVDLETAKIALEKEILVGKAMMEKGQGIYTDSSWKAYINAVSNAVQMSDKQDAVSSEVIGAVNRAKNAFRNLTVKADTSFVEAKKEFQSILSVLNTVLGKGQGNYTDASWKAFQDTIAQGSALAAKPSADKAEMMAMSQKLRLAANGLQLKPVTPPATPAVKLPKAGSVHKIGSLRYKVTKSAAKDGTVAVVSGMKNTMTKVSIPSSVKVNSYTFRVTEISAKAFKNYKKLSKVTIGKYVNSIGNYAFQNNTKLKKVTIGERVTKIGKYAFYGDKNLIDIQIKTKKLNSVGTSAFKKINRKTVIRVPKNKVSSYKKLFRGKGLPGSVEIKK